MKKNGDLAHFAAQTMASADRNRPLLNLRTFYDNPYEYDYQIFVAREIHEMIYGRSGSVLKGIHVNGIELVHRALEKGRGALIFGVHGSGLSVARALFKAGIETHILTTNPELTPLKLLSDLETDADEPRIHLIDNNRHAFVRFRKALRENAAIIVTTDHPCREGHGMTGVTPAILAINFLAARLFDAEIVNAHSNFNQDWTVTVNFFKPQVERDARLVDRGTDLKIGIEALQNRPIKRVEAVDVKAVAPKRRFNQNALRVRSRRNWRLCFRL
ncbi:MAG: hypothetical protein AAGA63_10505 [Pseudomonadota bacterium]